MQQICIAILCISESLFHFLFLIFISSFLSLFMEEDALVIDPSELEPGTATITEAFGEKVAVCKSDDGKIRIYKVVE